MAQALGLGLTPPPPDVTVEVYNLSLKERTKLKGLLEVVASSAEFEMIPIRRHEDVLLRRIYEREDLDKLDADLIDAVSLAVVQADTLPKL